MQNSGRVSRYHTPQLGQYCCCHGYTPFGIPLMLPRISYRYIPLVNTFYHEAYYRSKVKTLTFGVATYSPPPPPLHPPLPPTTSLSVFHPTLESFLSTQKGKYCTGYTGIKKSIWKMTVLFTAHLDNFPWKKYERTKTNKIIQNVCNVFKRFCHFPSSQKKKKKKKE